MLCRLSFKLLLGLGLLASLHAGEAPFDEAPPLVLQEGRIYRKINGEAITGATVIDLLLEESWDQQVASFVDYELCRMEIEKEKIEVADSDVETELQALLKSYADKLKINASELKLESLTREVGLAGGLDVLRRQTRVNLGLLRIFQQAKKLPAAAHTWEHGFKELVTERLDKVASQTGVVRDPQKLGTGEALRIGARSYPRDEVRQFCVKTIAQITPAALKNKLDLLTLEFLTRNLLKERNLELKQDDLDFHFSYLCRKQEMLTGIPGRLALGQQLANQGLTPEKFMRERAFKSDAALTLIAKTPIRARQLKAEFEAHPESYKRSENMIAHILLRVLDPDGRPYTAQWQAPGHDPLNAYVARCREDQFNAARPKIEGLVPEAKRDFASAAKNYSEDNATRMIGGKIGRVGPETILLPPCDNAVRDAAVKLKPGEVSGPVRSAFGWHLVKCLDQQGVTFDEAAERVYVNLIHQAKQVLQETMMKTAKIEDSF